MRIPAWAALSLLAAAACQRAPERPNDPERCATCHMDEFRSARNPVHVGTRPDTCAICHSQSSWHPSIDAHPWPLTGAHAKATCFECHSNPPKFQGTPKQCIGCHRDDYDKAPNHVAQKYPTKCEQCHQTTSWKNATGGPPPAATVPATATPPAPGSVPRGKPPGAPQPPTKPKPGPTPPDVTSHASPRR